MKYESVLLLTYDNLGWISIQVTRSSIIFVIFGFSQELLKLQNEHNENYLFHIFYGPFVGM